MILKGVDPSDKLWQIQHKINEKHFDAINLDNNDEVILTIYNPSLIQVNSSSFNLVQKNVLV